MAQPFAVNAIGSGPLMKHLPPLLPRPGMSVFATLSARVGSIGNYRLGGWCTYRASKAALNQPVPVSSFDRHNLCDELAAALDAPPTDNHVGGAQRARAGGLSCNSKNAI